MARQEVNIGVEGNDGTGDSIRESFRKSNENFSELYAVFGQGGTINFTALSDTPNELASNTIPLVNDAGTAIVLATLASNSAIDASLQDTITFSYNVAGKLIISTAFTEMSDDLTPTLGGPLSANSNPIANIEVSDSAAAKFGVSHGDATVTIDDLVINKGYADQRYIISDSTGTTPVRIADEPASVTQYTLTVNRYLNNNIEVLSHGYDTSINGTAFKFNAEDTDPSGLVTNTIYYIRRVDANNFTFHTSEATAKSQNQDTANTTKVAVSGTIAATDTHTLIDNTYDSTLTGNFLNNVALPRKSIVRRQGDDMTGALYLNDHPGELAGSGKPNGAEDMQAATKFYVDNTAYSSANNLFVSTTGDDLMKNVPSGKEGSSLTYAYKTIGAAMKRADELIKASSPATADLSPYKQIITKDSGTTFAEVTVADVVSPIYEQTRLIIEQNKNFIVKELQGYLKFTYPTFVYGIELCERDSGLILDSIALDINRGLNANTLTRSAAERYYSSASARKAITTQLTQTLASITFKKDLVTALLQQDLYQEKTVSAITLATTAVVTTTTAHGLVDKNQVRFVVAGGMTQINNTAAYIKKLTDTTFELFTDEALAVPFSTASGYSNFTTGKVGVIYQTEVDRWTNVGGDGDSTARVAVGAKFDLITNIVTNGISAGSDEVFGSNYKVVLNNGSLNFVDQGISTNNDLLPGKIITGSLSKAVAKIVSLTSNDASNGNNDTLQVQLLTPKDFEVGESILYGNTSRSKQIAVMVETGVYEEDYPIRVPANVSLKGDDYRRVIIRPKKRASQSHWANTYFYRDTEFDGLSTAVTGTPFYNQSNKKQGYFGYHYLVDADKPISVGSSITNVGKYTTAAEIIRLNKSFIAEEVIAWVDANKPNITYTEATWKTRTDLILNAIANDMALNTNYNAVDRGLYYQQTAQAIAVGANKEATISSIRYIGYLVRNLAAVVLTPEGIARLDDSINEIIDIVSNGALNTGTSAGPLEFDYPVNSAGVDVDADATRARKQLQANNLFLQAEIAQWVTSNHAAASLDSTRLKFEIGRAIDATSYDIQYGGNSAVRRVAQSWYNGATEQWTTNTAQRTAVTGALNYLSTIGEVVLVDNAVSNLQSGVLQNTTLDAASTSEQAEFSGLLQVMEDVVTANSTSGIPSETLPSVTWAALQFTTARTAIIGASTTTQNSVISFVNTNFVNYVHGVAKCRRDVKLILDSIRTDIIRGGSEFTTAAAGEYYYYYISKYADGGFLGQEAITRDSLTQIGTIIQTLLTGAYASGSILQNQSAAGYAPPVLTGGVGESNTNTLAINLVSRVTYAFNVAYNPPLRNDQMDMFLMNDSTIITNISAQGHGGFMCVLDPEGQILTKSPYIFACSSFSKSQNKKVFSGGMYLDAYVANLPVYVPQTINPGASLGGSQNGKINNFTLWIRSLPGEGLFLRAPLLPTPFYVEGRRYQINAISDYDSGNGWCKAYLDADSNSADGYDETQFANGLYYRDAYLQTSGNRSLLAQNFTQINDLGYGLICNNGAVSEQVSTFTYYNHAAFYAFNGSEIRALNCSNGYGNFGLVAEGADPNEIPDQVTLRDKTEQPAKVITTTTSPNAVTDTSIYVTDMLTPPLSNSHITIAHGGSTGTLNYNISSVSSLSDTAKNGVNGEFGDLLVTGVTSVTSIGAADAARNSGQYNNVQGTGGAIKNISNATLANPVVVTTTADHRLRDGSKIVIAAVSGMTNLNGNTYYSKRVTDTTFQLYTDEALTTTVDGTAYSGYTSGGTVTGGGASFNIAVNGSGAATIVVNRPGENYLDTQTITITDSLLGSGGAASLTFNVVSFGSTSGPGLLNNNVYKLDLKVDSAQATDFFGALQLTVPNDTLVKFRTVKSLIFNDITDPANLSVRPNTAINFDESDTATYRSIDFQTTDPYGISVGANSIFTTIDAEFATLNVSTTGDTNLVGGNGSAQGDTKIAITQIGSATDITRITRDVAGLQPGEGGYAGGMIFTHDGKTHQVTNYESDSTVAYLTIADIAGTNINSGYSGTGLNSAFSTSSSELIKLGINANTTAELTVSISLVRATGHDFTNIGTGSYNDSNYPNIILGKAENSLGEFYTSSATATTSQVWERRKGRVFFVSTDQYGFFRVGKFFSVDQATGLITFSGEIGLSNANALGFTKGVTINEFSADETMVDESGSAVPTEKAVVSYLNRRLGGTAGGSQVAASPGGNRIGIGYVPLNGGWPMEGTLQMGTNLVTGVANPGTDGTAATNKNYVDARVGDFDSLVDLRSVENNSQAKDDLLVATGKKRIYVSPPSGGTWAVGNTIQLVSNAAINGTIVDIETTTDQILGSSGDSFSVSIVTYTVGAGVFASGNSLTNSTATASVLTTPMDEWANAVEASGSDINITATRIAASTEIDLQIAPNSIINADVNASAAIVQSKLSMTSANTFDEDNATTGWAGSAAKVQADLGIAKFSDENFETTSGYVRIKAGGIAVAELADIGTGNVLARSSSGTGAVEEITFASAISAGGGIIDGDFSNTITSTDGGFPGSALIKLSAGVYGVAAVSTSSTGDTMVRRKTSGAIQANSFIIGGTETYEILSESSGTLTLKTPAQGTILSASGGSVSPSVTYPVVSIPGNVDIGTTGITTQSTFQAGSSYAANSFAAVDWTYTNFIEANGERDANGTGIGLGAGTGFAGSAADVIQVVTGGAVRVQVADATTTIINDLAVDGNTTLGSDSSDTVTITGRVDANILPNADNTINLGQGGGTPLKFNTIYATTFSGTATTARYADLAEKYLADEAYEPGTVVVLGGTEEITVTSVKGDHRVVGVVSTNPAYLMNSELEGNHPTDVAMTGRVPCKVIGEVAKGDMLIASAVPGYAIVNNDPRPGTVIGKSLENKSDGGKSTIEIIVGKV
jgi:hypothetical protein